MGDLYALADPLDRTAHWSDCYHHKPPLVEMLAECVAKTVLAQAFDDPKETRGRATKLDRLLILGKP